MIETPVRFSDAARSTRCGVAALLVVAASSALPALAQQTGPGRALYTANGCYQCHGYPGQGGVAGPRIAPSRYPYEAFSGLVRKPVNVMPAYASAVLSDADLRRIYEYVRSMPDPPGLDEIPALR